MNQYGDFGKETEELMTICERNDRIPPELFKEYGVKYGGSILLTRHQCEDSSQK